MAIYLNRDLLVALDEQVGTGLIEGYKFLQYHHDALDADEGDDATDEVSMIFVGPGDQVFRAPMELIRDDKVLLVGDNRVWNVHHLEESGEHMVEVFPVVSYTG